MSENILVPLDGSKVGEAALPVLANLLVKRKPEEIPEVTVLGVITLLTHWVVVGEASAPISYTDEELKSIEGRVRKYLKTASEVLTGEGITVHIKVKVGNAAEEILKVSEEINASMIAMSTHGRSGLRKLAFGSVTDKILRRAAMPVLLVRAPEGTDNVIAD